MSKGMEQKKNTKKKAAKSFDEKRAARRRRKPKRLSCIAPDARAVFRHSVMGTSADGSAALPVDPEKLSTPSTRLATRIAFFVAGFAVACWAPLVPYAKDRLAVDERTLGILLFCLGIGSLLAMFFTGMASARYGARPVIVGGSLGLCATLPFLALATTPITLGLTLLLFGASLGALDVAVNIHAVEVERGAGVPLMSGFHALYSLGGVAGAMFITLLLSASFSPFACVILASVLMLAMTFVSSPRLLRTRPEDGGAHFAAPRGVVLIIALLAAIMFLAEGAVLDWGALLITGKQLVDVEQGGIGFVVFSVAMTVGRFTGDALTARIGDRTTMVWGALVAITGVRGGVVGAGGRGRDHGIRGDRSRRGEYRPSAVPARGQPEGDAGGVGDRGGDVDGLRGLAAGPGDHRVRGQARGVDHGVLDDSGDIVAGAGLCGRGVAGAARAKLTPALAIHR